MPKTLTDQRVFTDGGLLRAAQGAALARDDMRALLPRRLQRQAAGEGDGELMESRPHSTRRGRPRRDPGSTWALREGYWNAMHRDARREAILAQLREAFPEGEQALCGWPKICAWLHEHGFRNREGGLVTRRVAAGWHRRLGMPLWPGRPGQYGLCRSSLPWASNYTLIAWASSLYRSGGPEMPRIVAVGSTQIEGREVVAGLAAPQPRARGRTATAGGSAEEAPDERGAIAAPNPAAGDCEELKPVAEHADRVRDAHGDAELLDRLVGRHRWGR